MVASTRTECFCNEPSQIGFDRAEDWLRADLVGRSVVFDKCGELPLDAACCRKLAAWLNRAAEQIAAQRDVRSRDRR